MSRTSRSLALVIVLASSALAQTTWLVPQQIPSIQGAIDAAAPGDSVLVDPGTYPESIDFRGKDLHVLATGGPGVTTIIHSSPHHGLTTAVRFAAGETRSAILEGFHVLCRSSDEAAAIGIQHAGPSIRNCFLRAEAPNGESGIRSHDGNPHVADCDVSHHFGLPLGVGMQLQGGRHALIENCLIEHNVGDGGGGVEISNVDVTIRGCTFRDNHTDATGHLSITASDVRIENTTFERSSSLALSISGASTVEIASALFTGNSGGFGPGAAILLDASTLVLDHVTIASNDNGYPGIADGGGVVVRSGATLEVSNSILWRNRPWELDTDGTSTVLVRHSHVEGGWAGPENRDLAPGFRALDDFRLRADSGCVDAGGPLRLSMPRTDPDDLPRLAYGARDRGAFEFHPSLAVTLDATSPAPHTLGLEILGFLPGATQITLLSDDALNDPNRHPEHARLGPLGGLFLDLQVAAGQATSGSSPFVSVLDASGRFAWQGAFPPALTGTRIWAVTHLIGATGRLEARSAVTTFTL